MTHRGETHYDRYNNNNNNDLEYDFNPGQVDKDLAKK